MSDADKSLIHQTKYTDLDVYLVNTSSGKHLSTGRERKEETIAFLNGTWRTPGRGRLTERKMNQYEKKWTSFQLITIDANPEPTRNNSFLSGLTVCSKTSPYVSSSGIPVGIRVESLSADFYKNGSVDAEIVAMLDMIGHINIENAGENLLPRRHVGRPRFNTNWSDVGGKFVTIVERTNIMIKNLQQSAPHKYYGFSVAKNYQYTVIGTVQSYYECRNNGRGKAEKMWTVHFASVPQGMRVEGIQEFDEDFGLHDLAAGMALAYDMQMGGPARRKTTPAAQPGGNDGRVAASLAERLRCDCVDPAACSIHRLQSRRDISKGKWFCKCNNCGYFRWETDLQNLMR
ncbi:MAG: hypothetical protein ACREBR_01595 [bacterium]